VDIIRRKDKRVPLSLLSDELMDVFADSDRDSEPENVVGGRELYDELYRGIQVLPEKSREVLVLYYFSEMKYREIAKVTNTSVKTVSTNLIRAKKHLREYMKERCPEMVSLSSMFSAINIQIAAQTGAGITATGVGTGAGVLAGKSGIFATLSNIAAPAAAGTAGAVAAAAIAYSALTAVPAYEIALTGDCDCGHINPQTIELEGTRTGDTLGKWELLTSGGKTARAGSLNTVTDYIKELENARKKGHYTLRCTVTGKNGDSYAVTRDITIGTNIKDSGDGTKSS
jgi:predicted DNA-binding protein YlxM (UPF0122 family)